MFKTLTNFIESLTQEQVDSLNAYVGTAGLNQGTEDIEAVMLRELNERLVKADAADLESKTASTVQKIRDAVRADPSTLEAVKAAVDAVVQKKGA